jgi:hypothetical protein
MATFSDQIHDGPVLFPSLHLLELQISQLTPAQTASEQDGENGTVALAFKSFWIRGLPESATLLGREPVPQPHTQLPDALHTTDAGCGFWTEQSSVGSFVGETSDHSEPSVYSSS